MHKDTFSGHFLNFLKYIFFLVIEKFDYVFPENGLVAYKGGELLSKQVGMKSSIN